MRFGRRNPILVTGSHRSGTTWVGRIIASSPAVAYIHEPFHLQRDPAVCGARFDHWFTYVCEDNEEKYYKHIRKMIGEATKDPDAAWYQRSRIRPLLKDPIALFSAQWLSSRFKTENLVMIRHPAAFAGSLKEKSWTHDFSHFTRQPLLMKHHLRPFAEEIRDFAREERDIVDQAGLLWKLIHYMILKYRETYPDWIYLRHEDLSRNPIDGFRSVFDRLGLKFSEQTREIITAHSFAESDSQATGVNLKRDSLSNIDTWKKRLTGPEIERLKSQVEEISRHFYSDDEW